MSTSKVVEKNISFSEHETRYIVNKKFKGVLYTFASPNLKDCQDFVIAVEKGKTKEFKPKVKTKPFKMGSYKKVEHCIRTTPNGSYQVRINRAGRRYEKVVKTLDDARFARDEMKTVTISMLQETIKGIAEGRCQRPFNVNIGLKVKFEFNETKNRMEIMLYDKGDWRTYTLNEEKTTELRNSLNGTIRRIKYGESKDDSRLKRNVTTANKRKKSKGKQQTLL